MSTVDPPTPMLHIYAQPRDEAYYKGQADFAASNPWYHFVRLEATSHFPTFEAAPQLAEAIRSFA
jgi:hypothetical protein